MGSKVGVLDILATSKTLGWAVCLSTNIFILVSSG